MAVQFHYTVIAREVAPGQFDVYLDDADSGFFPNGNAWDEEAGWVNDWFEPEDDSAGASAVEAVTQLGRRPVDTASSASRQHYIDTGRYLYEGEAVASPEPEPDVCDGCDGYGWFFIAHGGDESHAWVERCDNCEMFGSDLEAAEAASIQLDKPVAFAHVDCGGTDGGHHQPYIVGEKL